MRCILIEVSMKAIAYFSTPDQTINAQGGDAYFYDRKQPEGMFGMGEKCVFLPSR